MERRICRKGSAVSVAGRQGGLLSRLFKMRSFGGGGGETGALAVLQSDHAMAERCTPTMVRA